ncbi:MAG: hypothetical protein QNJ54_17310 [Prochloraceae cyanobacterium]|nr:hypothetical protein [Prochloraceae cyanobacterium]
MVNKSRPQFIGFTLQVAGLISVAQFKVAIRDQIYYPDMSLEEILVLRGWVKLETINFFLEQLPQLKHRKPKPLLKHCLIKAGLLTNQQIHTLVEVQKQTGIPFWSLAVRRGWIQQATIDFFINYFVENSTSQRNCARDKVKKVEKFSI